LGPDGQKDFLGKRGYLKNGKRFENENGHLCGHPKVEKKFAKSPRQSKSSTERGGMPNFSVF